LRLGTISIEHSPDLTPVGLGGDAYQHTGEIYANPSIALSNDRVSGHPLWHEYKWRKYLMSADMWEWLKLNDMHVITVDYDKHLEEI
jgi:hypothetical protein